MCEIVIYPITENLWRWEIRRGGSLFRCGTARSDVVFENVKEELIAAQRQNLNQEV